MACPASATLFRERCVSVLLFFTSMPRFFACGLRMTSYELCWFAQAAGVAGEVDTGVAGVTGGAEGATGGVMLGGASKSL